MLTQPFTKVEEILTVLLQDVSLFSPISFMADGDEGDEDDEDDEDNEGDEDDEDDETDEGGDPI